jgi:tetratricopeptide (TPR) repeat protein
MSYSDHSSDATSAAAGDNPLIQLAREAADIAVAGDIKRGLGLALEAIRRARAAGDRRAEMEALNAAARCHSLRNDSINALAAGIDAATLARSLDDGVALGHALCAIVNTAFVLKLLEECEPFILRAVEEGARHGDRDLEARARQGYGVLLGDLQRFDEARAQLELAVNAARCDGRPALLLRVEGNLANVPRKEVRMYAAKGDRVRLRETGEAALAGAALVLERARALKVPSVEMNMTHFIAEVRALMGDLDFGISETTRAVEMAQQLRYTSNQPPMALNLGRMLREQGRFQESVDAIQRGLEAAENLRPTFRIAELCDAMAQTEAARGDAPKAEAWQKRAEQERAQFETGRRVAAGFLMRLRQELALKTGD